MYSHNAIIIIPTTVVFVYNMHMIVISAESTTISRMYIVNYCIS